MLVNNNNTKKYHEKNNYNKIADVFNPLYNNPDFNNISGLGDDGNNALDTNQLSNLNTLEDASSSLEITEYNYKRAIFEYLTLLNSNNGHGQMNISLEVIQKIFINGASRCEKHQKTVRVINDEDVVERCHTISIKTAIRWLRVLGYSFQQYHHGIYYNGYERKNMLQYQKELLEKIFDHENYMSKYEGEFIDQICPNLPERGKKRVLVVHDEYQFCRSFHRSLDFFDFFDLFDKSDKFDKFDCEEYLRQELNNTRATILRTRRTYEDALTNEVRHRQYLEGLAQNTQIQLANKVQYLGRASEEWKNLKICTESDKFLKIGKWRTKFKWFQVDLQSSDKVEPRFVSLGWISEE
ncbi:hypothetical protein RhiirA1_461308 [Rhizophagus irregularis]|uniref:Uncharacterized protein n=1 Tax=Rhizophagus irregularis TaxID=588596 RepID=A0A2N0RPI3_9GLOM|nr:hypothetical protein RhiirA1_461308 [Rhizophagus irregularis]